MTQTTTPAPSKTSAAEITPAEWELMRVVWTLDHASSRTIIDVLQRKRDWSESTIKTLLNRLTAKGFLATEREGNTRRFIYRATIAEASAMDEAAGDLFNHMCAMKKGQAIIDVLERQEMNRADIEKAIEALQTKLVSAPEMVQCDCLPGGVAECK